MVANGVIMQYGAIYIYRSIRQEYTSVAPFEYVNILISCTVRSFSFTLDLSTLN